MKKLTNCTVQYLHTENLMQFMPPTTHSVSHSLSLQGSIQQLVIKDDPRAAEEQCEDDDPYVRSTY